MFVLKLIIGTLRMMQNACTSFIDDEEDVVKLHICVSCI